MRTPNVQPNAENASLEDLQLAMEAAPNKRSYIRLAAIRSLLLGVDRATVCRQFCRSDRMVRLWIQRFNQGGIDALASKVSTGRPRKVRLERVGDLLLPVLADPSMAGQTHWTGRKLHGYLNEQLELELGYTTVLRWLHELDFHRRVPRPWPEGQDEDKRAAFLKQIKPLCQDPSVELWFCDESGFEGDPRPRRRWVRPGSKPTLPYLGRHIRQNVIGSVCPQSGELFCLIVDGVDTEVFQFYLDEMARSIPAKADTRQIVVLDNASWHKAARLKWHHFEPLYLPAYSPDFNPIERLWLRVKADWFYDFIARDTAELTGRVEQALRSFINDPSKTASICSFRK